ncbi:5-oxoprolinase subunit PxpA [Psychroserpens sp.]|uniref:5-oxoprolinase subunit PxpA n=1 Tax=Psychroserpens sp. TaxID=2020870 RepID=UPI001B29318C|nr:5-oxoprolinase subunit PxpA [Psychroserpens sp.]MBO6606646.1 5-oxoprolinase subunit PxpA [Psychroserpens sp.]MBO6631914.1 5-oxoprolinase subunit PxpA [Psychroserpens sp.]MBO6653350.1 5-oxoprolinase subunit PxpA [Psychroserpens sp.]MBO6680623.1 5-oxoprolinase subunit PxpA [Psychroserpens sp.]MBO6750419.1 5-oxoprolinase subunit PxpA [Psychroserpens sp.]
MVVKRIDINCDLGEGIGNEAELMPYLSSCNIACGGHAGDKKTMRKVAKLAESFDVRIGAHPSFPDREHFGRIVIPMSSEALKATLVEQIETFQNILRDEGLELHHIKPHGALYNLAAKDEQTAEVLVEVLIQIDLNLILYAPYNSVISKVAAQKGVTIAYEAFMDRNYNDDLSLVSRQEADALITNPETMFEHVNRMINDKQVKTITGRNVKIEAHTFCVHGDGEGVVQNLKYVTKKLQDHNIKIN